MTTGWVANSSEENCNLHWIMSLNPVEALEPGECDIPGYNLTKWTELHLCWLFIVYLPEEDFFSSVPTIYAFEQCIVLWPVPCACIDINDMRENLQVSTQTHVVLSGICQEEVLYKLSPHYLCINQIIFSKIYPWIWYLDWWRSWKNNNGQDQSAKSWITEIFIIFLFMHIQFLYIWIEKQH